jgi:Tfp pilus assembly protein PilO
MRTLQTQIGWCARAQWVLGVSIVALSIGFVLLGFRPKTAKLAELDTLIDAKQQELRDNQTKTTIRPYIERQVAESKRKTAMFEKQLPKQVEWGQFLNDITLLRDQAGLRDCYIVPTGAKPNDLFVEFPIQVKFEGDFLSVFAFLRQMEQMQRLTRVRDLTIKSKGSGSGVVEVQLSMNIYYTER